MVLKSRVYLKNVQTRNNGLRIKIFVLYKLELHPTRKISNFGMTR